MREIRVLLTAMTLSGVLGSCVDLKYSTSDATLDAASQDVSVQDLAPTDTAAAPDASVDEAMDSAQDTSVRPESGVDAGNDVDSDAPTDIDIDRPAPADGGTDSGVDVGLDSRADLGADVRIDVPADAPPEVIVDAPRDVVPMTDVAPPRDLPSDPPPTPVAFNAATASATFSQMSFPVSAAVDGDRRPNHGWGVANAMGAALAARAMFALVRTTPVATTTRLYITMDFTTFGHLLGNFRIAYTRSDPTTFADGVSSDGGMGGLWTYALVSSAMSNNGVTLEPQTDQTIRATGATAMSQANYTIIADAVGGGITGIRLEAIRLDGLPGGGPGTAPALGPNTPGNFVLTELTMAIGPR